MRRSRPPPNSAARERWLKQHKRVKQLAQSLPAEVARQSRAILEGRPWEATYLPPHLRRLFRKYPMQTEVPQEGTPERAIWEEVKNNPLPSNFQWAPEKKPRK